MQHQQMRRNAVAQIWKSWRCQRKSRGTHMYTLTCTVQSDTHTHTLLWLCEHTQSFWAGTFNRKLTVLCDTMECSREQQPSSTDLHPTTILLFVLPFPQNLSSPLKCRCGALWYTCLFLFFKRHNSKKWSQCSLVQIRALEGMTQFSLYRDLQEQHATVHANSSKLIENKVWSVNQ